jgi:NADH-quinone oxidoreductase subunit E
MIDPELKERLRVEIQEAETPREKAVDVMGELQKIYGWITDEAMCEASELLGMTLAELEELATFYNFLYREPVGKYVIHICDSVVCWMDGYNVLLDHLKDRLGIELGETTSDGLFTLLPVCCIGYCDRSPAMLINRRVLGKLTPKKIDRIIDQIITREQKIEQSVEQKQPETE